MAEFAGRWTGQLRAGAEADHGSFVERLSSPEGADLLRRCGLTRYALYRQGAELEIHFKSEKPSIIAGFLRNKRMWPDYWVFVAPGADASPDKPLVFEWSRGEVPPPAEESRG